MALTSQKESGATEMCVTKPVTKTCIHFSQKWGSDPCVDAKSPWEANSAIFTFLVSQLTGSKCSTSANESEKHTVTWVESEPRIHKRQEGGRWAQQPCPPQRGSEPRQAVRVANDPQCYIRGIPFRNILCKKLKTELKSGSENLYSYLEN